MFCFLQVFLSLFSAGLMALAIPNEFYHYGNPFLGIICLVPFYIALSNAKSYRRTFLLCFLHGVVTHLLSSYWLSNFQGMAAFTLGASTFGTAMIEGLTGLLFHYPYTKNSIFKENLKLSIFEVPFKIFWFTFIYVIYEWCKSTGFLAYPWGTVSMTAWNFHLLTQIVDITGPYGLTFIFVFISALLGEGFVLVTSGNSYLRKDFRHYSFLSSARFILAVYVLSMLYGTWQYSKKRTPVKTIDTVMVQQNMQTFRANEEDEILLSEKLTDQGFSEFNVMNKKPDLVVWSEGVLNKYFPDSQYYYEIIPESKPLMTYIKQKKVPFIIGGSLTINREKHKFGNAAILISPKGKFTGAYVKLHLVPFAEAIPFVEYEFVRNFIKKIAGFSYGWTQGSRYVLFDIPIKESNLLDSGPVELISPVNSKKTNPTVKVSVPICYDDAFGHVCRGLFLAGSELFMNITNDSWSQKESAEYQHFVIAAYRAIEFRTTLARCTNAGVTAVVDPSGRILQSLPLFTEGYLACSIPVYEHKMTFYARYGEWLPYSIMILVLIIIISLEKFSSENKITEISTELLKKSRRRKIKPVEEV